MIIREIKPGDLKEEARKLGRLIAISFLDGFVFYHFSQEEGKTPIAFKVKPIERKLPSLIDLFPSAGIYERELHDFFELEFEGNPRLHEKLFLSDDFKGAARV